MATWGEFARAAPELADRGERLLGVGVAYIGTSTSCGAPRVHPFSPLISDGRLLAFLGKHTVKYHNLLRDPRFSIHAVLGDSDEEFMILGSAIVSDDWASRMQAAVEARKINMTSKDDATFEFPIERVHWAIWEGLGTQYYAPGRRKLAGELMATWREFAGAQPEMAQVLRGILEWIPIAYLATVRKDGSPRVHPFCPVFADGRMFIAVNETSPKRWDLKNDGRYSMHSLPGKWRENETGTIGDDEFYATGRSRLVEDNATRQAVSDAAGHTIHESDWLFELCLEYVMTAYWEKVGQPGTYAIRREWRSRVRVS